MRFSRCSGARTVRFRARSDLADAGGLIAGEGMIYPLLARLRLNGLVQTTWKESAQGPPRRYYRLTEAGDIALTGFVDRWKLFRDAAGRILEEAFPA